MDNLVDNVKEIFNKLKNLVIKIGVKKVTIGGAIAIIGVIGIALLCSGSSEKVVLANVVHPNYVGGGYIYNEVKEFKSISVSDIKLKHKENKVNNNKTLAGDVEFEFTIKNITKETIDNIGYTLFLKDLNGRPFAIRGKEMISLKSGEKTKIKVSSIWCKDNCDQSTTDKFFVDDYNKDYATLNIYKLISTNSDRTINTSDL